MLDHRVNNLSQHPVIPAYAYMDVGGRATQEQLAEAGIQLSTIEAMDPDLRRDDILLVSIGKNAQLPQLPLLLVPTTYLHVAIHHNIQAYIRLIFTLHPKSCK